MNRSLGHDGDDMQQEILNAQRSVRQASKRARQLAKMARKKAAKNAAKNAGKAAVKAATAPIKTFLAPFLPIILFVCIMLLIAYNTPAIIANYLGDNFVDAENQQEYQEAIQEWSENARAMNSITWDANAQLIDDNGNYNPNFSVSTWANNMGEYFKLVGKQFQNGGKIVKSLMVDVGQRIGVSAKNWYYDTVDGEVVVKTLDEEDVVTEEELKALIEVGEKEGTLEAGEKQMLYKIFRFSDLTVHNIMKHRSLIKAVPLEANKLEIVDMFVQTGVNMIPVYKESKETIVGVIHYKSVLMCASNKVGKSYAETVMKGVLFVPETLTALELLSKFRKERTEFAVALNEQGETAGIVTMDDIMRVVFGRMTDEDIGRIPAEARIKFVSANEFVVPGDITLDELNSIFKINLESEEYSTLGGWILERFGSLPSTGEITVWNGILFVVEDQAARRVQSVRIKFRENR